MNNKHIKTLALIVLGLTLLFSGCDFFQPGLGDSVDIDPPSITVDQGDNFYIQADTLVSGTVHDDISVASLQLSYTGVDGNIYSRRAAISGSRWSLTLSSGNGADSDIAEGEQTLMILAVDGKGRETMDEKVCRVDNQPPTVLVTSPLSYVISTDTTGLEMSKYLDLKGEVYDEFFLAEVRIQLINQSGTVIAEKAADGTNSWFCRFLLKSSTDTTFTDLLIDGAYYGYRVIATDAAGNSSSGYLHRNDFYDMIPGLSLFPSMDEIGKADRDNPVIGSLVTSYAQLEDFRHYLTPPAAQLTLAGFLYSDNNMPNVSYQNLEDDGSGELFRGSDIVGYVEPAANGPAILASSISVTIMRDAYATPYLSLSNTASDDSDGILTTAMGDSINFTIPLIDGAGEDLPADSYTITLEATDEEGTSAELRTIEFTIISGDYPNLDITAPSPTSIPVQNSAFTVSGTGSEVDPEDWFINFYIDDVLDDTASSDSSHSGSPDLAGDLSWSYTMGSTVLDGLAEGTHLLKIVLSGAEATLRFKKDTSGPEIEVIDPQSGTTHNGGFTLIGSCSDDNSVSLVEVHMGKNIVEGDYQTATGTYSWSLAVPAISSYASGSFANEIDPISKAPSTGSGFWELPIYIRGTDEVGNTTLEVSYSLYLEPAGDIPSISIISPANNEVTGGSIRIYGTALDDDMVDSVEFELDADNDGTFELSSEAGDYTLNGTNSWYVVINESGELESATLGEQETIQYRVRVRDSKDGGITGDVYSDWLTRTLTIDNTIPSIESLRVDYDSTFDNDYSDGFSRDYAIGLIVKGTFYLDFMVRDDSGIADLYRIDSGPLSGSTLLDSSTYDADSGSDAQGPWRHVRISVDSESFYSDSSGSFSLNLKVTDITDPNPYIKYENITLLVDNRYPSGTFSGSSDVSGTYNLQGTATDTGTVQGIDHVDLFLMKGSNYYAPDTGASTTTPTLDTLDLKNSAGTDTTLDVPSGAYLVTVDDSTDLTQNGASYDWFYEIDSSQLPDGPMTAYYLVSDNAGNTTYYTEDLYIMNNPPEITSIELGTDLNGDTIVTYPAEYSSYTSPYTNTGFTVRNNMLAVRVNASGGNNGLYCQLDDQSATLGGSGAMILISGDDYYLTVNDGAFPADTGSLSSYTLRVFDATVSSDTDYTDELNQSGGHNGESISLGLYFDNDDDTDPSINVAPFGQIYSGGSDDTSKILETVSSYGINTGASGGHVDYAAFSTNDAPGVEDTDLSGQVVFLGKVWDDQKVDDISFTIPGYNGSNPFNVLLDGVIQTSADWTFAFSDEFLTEAYGVTANWSFTFDTSLVTNEVAENITITATVSDGSPSSVNTTDTLDVDIVPYITSVTRPAGYNTHRSRYGRYPVQSSETLNVTGYNLNGTATAGSGTASGELTLTIGALDSVNNSNDNDACWNLGSDYYYYNRMDSGVCEADLSDSLWGDDIYLMVWVTGDYFPGSDSSFVGYPSMSQDTDGMLYAAWSERSENRMVYTDLDDADTTALYTTLDPPECTDIYIGAEDEVNIAYLTNYQSGNNWGWLGVYTDNSPGSYSGSYYGVESLRDDERLLQFLNPRIVVDNETLLSNDDDIVHLVYYDSYTSTAKYSCFVDDGIGNDLDVTGSGAVGIGNNDNAQGFIALDGSETDLAITFSGISSSSAAGEHIALDLDEMDYPVVLYFDNAAATLRLAHCHDGVDTIPDATDWTIQSVFASGDTYADQSGTHVMMKIDSLGNIHALCYNNSNTDLIYLYAENVDTGDYTFKTSILVDNQGASGEGLDLVLYEEDLDLSATIEADEVIPYVSYHYLNKLSTLDGLKYAYPVNWNSILGIWDEWEYMITPLENAIQPERTQIEYNSGDGTADPWTGTIAIGYLSDRYELIYLQE